MQHLEAVAVAGMHMFDLEKRAGLVRGLDAFFLADADEGAGVFFPRGLDHLLRGAVFHGLSVTQHHDVVGDLGDDRKIVGDVEGRRVGLFDRVLDGREHVDLGRHVERRGRLVEDDQFRIGQSAMAVMARCNCPPDTWWG